jgi:hypothetical protein
VSELCYDFGYPWIWYKIPGEVDKEIHSLVVKLNQLGYIRTIGSCAKYDSLGDGTYRRHSLDEYCNPYLVIESNGDAIKCSQALGSMLKHIANAYYWGISPSENESDRLSPDAKASFDLYRMINAERLFWLEKPTFWVSWGLDILPILRE